MFKFGKAGNWMSRLPEKNWNLAPIMREDKASVVYKPTPGDPGDVTPELCCPECGTELEHFSGLDIPEYLYCPVCNDTAFDPENGNFSGRLV